MGVIVVYDATMLVGSKCDPTEEKAVDYRTAKDFADERGIMLMEVGAKDGTNVELAFLTLVAKIRQADFTSMSSEVGVK